MANEKIAKFIIDVSAEKKRTQMSDMQFFSMDHKTAKIVVQAEKDGEMIAKTSISRVEIMLESLNAGYQPKGKVILNDQMTVDDDGLFSYVLPDDLLNYSGLMAFEVYIYYTNGDVSDSSNRIVYEQRVSAIDRNAGQVELVYIKDMETVKREITEQATEITENFLREWNAFEAGSTVKMQELEQEIDEQTEIFNKVDVYNKAEIEDKLEPFALQTDIAEVSAQLAQTDKKTLGIPLAPMSNVKVEEGYTGVLPIAFQDGWLYGFQNNTTIVRSNNDGKTWSTVAASPSGSLHSMYWTDDGEVLLGFNENIRKSIGWSNNPQTATWKVVVTRSKGLGILPWGIDGDGTKFIATEYSASDRSESRYVWISTDMGETFNVVVDKYETDPENTSHMHGVCYDKWADRFFLSHGHGVIEGVYWSDDDGVNWNLVEVDFELDASPTTLTATINGIVGGSDSGRAGLYGIQRTENPHDMVMRRTARWDVSREGVTGFAYRSIRDEETGQVYVAFKSDFGDIAPVIMAGTATTGALLWQDTVGSGASFQFLTVTDKKVIGVHGAQGAYKLIVGNKPSHGVDTFDSGNILTGKATSTSIAIGQNVDVKTANEIVIGNNATLNSASSNTLNVVIGTNVQGTSRDVVIGNNAKSNTGGDDGVVIGNGANSSSTGGIVLGLGATVPVSSTYGIAIGRNTTASINGIAIGNSAKIITSTNSGISIGNNSTSRSNSVAIGRDANAGTSQVAIGHNANSGHGNSIALGSNSVTTGENQLALGKRHIELEVATTPGIPPIGNVRVYLKENASGKQELCVRFRNAEVVIATQP